MEITETVTLIKDLILSGAAITGALIANKGLTTWKRQLKGNSEYELSRRILVTLYKYRDVINGVRHPIIWSYEMPTPSEEESKNMTPSQVAFYGTHKNYIARWEKVQAERRSLHVDLFEAEAIWGEDLKKLFKKLFQLENELFTYLQCYFEMTNPKSESDKKTGAQMIIDKRRDIMYDDLSEEGENNKRNQCFSI